MNEKESDEEVFSRIDEIFHNSRDKDIECVRRMPDDMIKYCYSVFYLEMERRELEIEEI